MRPRLPRPRQQREHKWSKVPQHSPRWKMPHCLPNRMLGKKKNQTVLVKALEKEFLGDPVRFFKTVIMPLLPRESKLKFDHDGVVQWRSLLGGGSEDGLPGRSIAREEETGD